MPSFVMKKVATLGTITISGYYTSSVEISR